MSEGDLADRHGIVSAKGLHRGLDAQRLDVLVRRGSVARLEQAREVMRAEADLVCQAAQRQTGAEVLPDQLRQPALLCRSQRMATYLGVDGALRAAAARHDAEQRDAQTLYVQRAVLAAAQRFLR